MCGITGVFNTDGRPVSIEVIKRMTDVVRHRGPDGEGYWTDSFVGFGHRRLAIIDLSSLGHQPMQNDDGSLVITYNGEIYNHLNLMSELQAKGVRFNSKSDTEVLLKAYETWGVDCLPRLQGMFAFAIWDKRHNSLLMARDRYGLKPLYFAHTSRSVIFGSEIKSILEHPSVEARVCLEALSEYFSFQNTLTDRTLFEGVVMLPPGSHMTVRLGDDETAGPQRYWDFAFEEDNTLSREDCIEEVDRLFVQAVQRHLLSDVEVGSYLSGGMDSGSVVAAAAGSLDNLKTFTCGFDLSSASGLELNFDERAKAELLSNIFKTEQYEVVLKAGDMERVMPDLIWHLEDLRVGQSYPNFYVSRLASKFVKVVLSGTGGDEMFAGYPWRYYAALPELEGETHFDKSFEYWQRLVPLAQKESFFRPSSYGSLPRGHERTAFSAMFGPHGPASTAGYINRSLNLEAKTFLHGLLVVEDKLSMAHGLETRVPFLDNDLVDFAQKIPVAFKLRGIDVRPPHEQVNSHQDKERYLRQTMDGKLVLREALSRHLPEEYTDAKKQGFSAPDASWFRGESVDYIGRLLGNKRARIYDFLDYDSVSTVVAQHRAGEANQRLMIWSLLSFEWWNQVFIK